MAKVTARALATLLQPTSLSPFNYIRFLLQNGGLEGELRRARIGQYARLVRLLTEVMNRNICLRTCSVEDLESLPGIGPKTARFFILHTRLDQTYAVLDVHIMRWLNEEGYEAPVRPRNNEEYAFWETIFLNHADNYTKLFTNVKIAELDLLIWTYGVKKRERTFNGNFNQYLKLVMESGV
ncbi:MAG: hypothetical protein HC836_32775 [Richelia sp. RM2_1_2]|nr:hypothetical protein [Richelia sp. RM2_1_2]